MGVVRMAEFDEVAEIRALCRAAMGLRGRPKPLPDIDAVNFCILAQDIVVAALELGLHERWSPGRVRWCLNCVRAARINACVDRVDDYMDATVASCAIVPAWTDVLGSLFIVECQLRMLVMDAGASVEPDADPSLSADQDAGALTDAECAYWVKAERVRPLPMSDLSRELHAIMRRWSEPAAGEPTRMWCQAGLLCISRPLISGAHDHAEWTVDGPDGTTRPAPAFFRVMERANTLTGARTMLAAHVARLGAPEEAASVLRESDAGATRAWWQAFDVAHMTATLGIEVGEACLLATGLTPLDPYLMRGGAGGIPEENRSGPVSWILSNRYPDEVQAVRKQCEAVLDVGASLIELFSYTVQQACGFQWKNSCFVSDRQPVRALRKLRAYASSQMLRPLPLIVELAAGFVVLRGKDRPSVAAGDVVEAVAVWSRELVETHGGVLGRKANIRVILDTILSTGVGDVGPRADRVAERWATAAEAAGRTVQLHSK